MYNEAVIWRRGRAVECTSLLKRQALTGLEGSNPSVSATAVRTEHVSVRADVGVTEEMRKPELAKASEAGSGAEPAGEDS